MIAHFLLHLLLSGFDTFKDVVIHAAEVTGTTLSVNQVISLLHKHVNDKKFQLRNPTSATTLFIQSSSENDPLVASNSPSIQRENITHLLHTLLRDPGNYILNVVALDCVRWKILPPSLLRLCTNCLLLP